MSCLARRRPLLRAIAIRNGAYLDCTLRIEVATLLGTLQRPDQGDRPGRVIRRGGRVA